MSEVVCWRLCLAHRAEHAFSGEGSARRGGRWNARGVRLVYSSDSRSLAALEVLVNIDERHRLIGLDWVCIPAMVDADLVERREKFPPNWRRYPHGTESQVVGGEWVHAGRSVVLRVPSAVVPGEFNYLLNPAHPEFDRVKIGEPEPFSFDPRLV